MRDILKTLPLLLTLLAPACRDARTTEWKPSDAPPVETKEAPQNDTTLVETKPVDISAPPAPPIEVKVETPSNDGRTERAARSFVTTDHLVFTASAAELAWNVEDGEDGALDPPAANGSRYEVVVRPTPSSRARSGPLRYAVKLADASRSGTFVVEQDEIDTIRQQYIDMTKKRVPRRSEFITTGRSRRGYFEFAEVQSRDRAPFAVFTALDHLDEWRDNYGAPLRVNRGYTTPRHNASIRGAAKNSQHLYGTAADIDSEREDWSEKRDAAREAGACTEPLSICGYHHVHADWRKECPAGW